MRLSLAQLLLVTATACAVPDRDDAPARGPTECAFDDVAFDPHGPVVQGANETACARLDREVVEPTDERRGIEWRALALAVVTTDGAWSVVAPAYENTHHNCLDRASADADGASLALLIDGAGGGDASACFGGEGWRIVLTVDGTETALEPHEP